MPFQPKVVFSGDGVDQETSYCDGYAAWAAATSIGSSSISEAERASAVARTVSNRCCWYLPKHT